jgi:hypothetical protein
MGFGFKMPSLKKATQGVAKIYMGGGVVGQGINNAVVGKDGRGGPSGFGSNGTPQFGMRSTSEFMEDTPAEQIKRVKLDGGAMSRRFGALRERTGQEINAGAQRNSDAMTRRFASMGSTGSGAAIKMQQQGAEEADRMKAQAMQDINIQEEDANMAREGQQAQMDQQVNLAQADMNFRQKAFNFEKGSKLHELNLAERQMQVDNSTTEFNKRVAAEQSKKPKQGLLSGMLDGWL